MQEFSADVQKLWEEKYKIMVVQEYDAKEFDEHDHEDELEEHDEEHDAEEELSQDTPTTSTECYDRECEKVDQC